MSMSATHGLSGLNGLNIPSRGSGKTTAASRVAAICLAVDRPLRAAVSLGSLASGVSARRLMSLTHCLVNGADSGGGFVLRRKTQVRGRSNRAIAARPMVCSALGGELRGDRENPRQQRLIEQVARGHTVYKHKKPSP